MQPRPAFSAKQKKIILITSGAASCGGGAIAVLGAGLNDLTIFMWAGMVIGAAGLAYVGWPAGDGLPATVRGGRERSPSGRGLDADAGPALTSAIRWPVLRAVARFMPPAAGRRWLAEADSLLFELAPGRRSKAVRSYLLSAPRLVIMMWVGELSRRAPPRFRRPRKHG